MWGRFYANAAFQTGSVFKRTAHNWIVFYVYMRDYTVFRELIKYLQPLGLIKSFQAPPDLVKDMVPGKLRLKELSLDSSRVTCCLLHAHKGTKCKEKANDATQKFMTSKFHERAMQNVAVTLSHFTP